MYPILLELGPLKIFTYGLMVATGFFVAILLAANHGKKEGFDPQMIMDLCFYILLSAILGARMLYVIVEYKYFLSAPLEISKVLGTVSSKEPWKLISFAVKGSKADFKLIKGFAISK